MASPCRGAPATTGLAASWRWTPCPRDPRATAIYYLLQQLRLASGVNAYAGTTAPLEGSTNDRRHPDSQFFVSPAKLAALLAASRPAPVPDLVVEVDTTPLSPHRECQRLAAYARMGVPEVWVWRRTGGTRGIAGRPCHLLHLGQ